MPSYATPYLYPDPENTAAARDPCSSLFPPAVAQSFPLLLPASSDNVLKMLLLPGRTSLSRPSRICSFQKSLNKGSVVVGHGRLLGIVKYIGPVRLGLLHSHRRTDGSSPPGGPSLNSVEITVHFDPKFMVSPSLAMSVPALCGFHA